MTEFICPAESQAIEFKSGEFTIRAKESVELDEGFPCLLTYAVNDGEGFVKDTGGRARCSRCERTFRLSAQKVQTDQDQQADPDVSDLT